MCGVRVIGLESHRNECGWRRGQSSLGASYQRRSSFVLKNSGKYAICRVSEPLSDDGGTRSQDSSTTAAHESVPADECHSLPMTRD
jgi:hypothetical protein